MQDHNQNKDDMDFDMVDDDMDSPDIMDQGSMDGDDQFMDEDEAFAEEEWEEEGSQEEDPKGKGKKEKKGKKGKSLSFNTIVISLAVLVGLGIMVMQLAKPKDPNAVPAEPAFQSALVPQGQVNNPVTKPIEAPALPTPITAQEQETQPAPQEGFLQNPDLANQPAPQQADVNTGLGEGFAPPMPAPIAPIDTAEKVGEALIVTDSLPVPSPDALTPLPEVATTEPVEQPAVQENPVEPGTAESFLQEKIEERAEQALAPIVSELPSAPALPDPRDEEIQTLKAQLQSANDELSGTIEAKAQEIGVLNDEIASLKAELENLKAQRDVAPAPTSAQKEQTPQKTAAKPAAKSPAKPAAKAIPKAPPAAWELRAAMPGKAWVSEKGQKEMRSVVPGDSLPGIGQVTSITYNGGVWTVEGTKGRITQ